MKRILLFVSILLLLAVVAALPAQEESCDRLSIAQTLSEIDSDIEEIKTFITGGGSTASTIAFINAMQGRLSQLNENCFNFQTVAYYVNSNSGINARSCPRTACSVVVILQPDTAIRVLESVSGDSVNGSDEWYHGFYNDQEVYVHSSLMRDTKLRPTSMPLPTARPQSSNTGSSGQQAVSTVAPPPVSTAPPAAPSFVCDCSKTCEAMASCEEAYFQLNQCGCSRRDSDHDGVPCESICPGG